VKTPAFQGGGSLAIRTTSRFVNETVIYNGPTTTRRLTIACQRRSHTASHQHHSDGWRERLEKWSSRHRSQLSAAARYAISKQRSSHRIVSPAFILLPGSGNGNLQTHGHGPSERFSAPKRRQRDWQQVYRPLTTSRHRVGRNGRLLFAGRRQRDCRPPADRQDDVALSASSSSYRIRRSRSRR
jgi:hypothetical protein